MLTLLSPSFAQLSPHQPSPAPLRDAQALALLARCAATTSSLPSISDISASGTMSDSLYGDAQRPFVFKAKGPDQIRQEVTYPDRVDTTIIAKGSGWTISQGARKPMPSWSARFQRAEYFPALVCATEATRTDTDIAYVGPESLAGVTVQHIKISAAPRGKSKEFDDFEAQISVFHLYLDSSTNLPAASRYLVFSPATPVNSSVWQSVYSDYHSVSGVTTPFHIECSVSGQKWLAVQFSQVSVNSGLADSEFQPN